MGEDPPSAHSAAGATVPDGGREAVASDTVGANASNVCAAGGRTPAPRRRAVSRADRKPDIQGTAREAQPGARSAAGAVVADPDGEAVTLHPIGANASRTYPATGTNPAPTRAVGSRASSTTDLPRADRSDAKL